MAIKHILPLSVRNRFRPMYQQMYHCQQQVGRSLVNSTVWPKPAEWHRLRKDVDETTDLRSLYRIAEREFGILQKENEIVGFLEYARAQSPRFVGEIGLKFGGNSFLFSRAFAQANRILAIDLWLQNVGKVRFLTRHGQKMQFMEGSSCSQPILQRVQRWLGSNRFDFLFIDGDHSYEGVVRDFVAYYPFVRPGGLIALHDIAPDEYGRFGARSPGSLFDGGEVYLLWRRLRERFPFQEFVNDWNQFGYGIGVITKPDDTPLPTEWVESLNDRNIARQMSLRSPANASASAVS